MDDVTIGIVYTVCIAVSTIICIALRPEEKLWRRNILAFFCYFCAGTLYNWQWWVALLVALGLVALGEVIAIRFVLPLFRWLSAPAEDERDLDTIFADLDRAIEASKAKEESTTPTAKSPLELTSSTQPRKPHNSPVASCRPPVVNTPPQKTTQKDSIDEEKNTNRVEQTLLSCLRCGGALSGKECTMCNFDHTKRSIRLLVKVDSRDLQISR